MNGKYIFALFVALQVSMSLGEIAEPDPELVAKFEEMKNTFYNRLQTAYNKVQGLAAPYVESAGEYPQVQTAKDYFEEVKSYPQTESFIKFFTDMVGEAAPLMDKAQTTGLGLYGQYLRPYVGETLDGGINKAKEYLNVYLPAE